MLPAFARWFASRAGVIQTAVLCTVIVVLELLHIIHDSNGFWLLYALTVYSAVTQPVLAYSNNQESESTAAILNRIEAMEARILQDVEHGD